jgi:Uma2 family endonuclease
MATTISKPVTAEELLAMGDVGRCELIDGEIIHLPLSGMEHGLVVGELVYLLMDFVESSELGEVISAGTGFVIRRNPDTVLAPDVAFVRRDRMPSGLGNNYVACAPDLAVEVVSFNDITSELASKVDQWLEAGTQSVWVVDPPNRTIAVYRAGNQVLRYKSGETLHDDPALPGFVLKLDDLFVSA